MKWLVILAFMPFCAAHGQKGFEFYGTEVGLLNISNAEYDSLMKQEAIPVQVRNYLETEIRTYDLDDWALVLFLRTFVDSQFADYPKPDKVRILSRLLSWANINNAIGVRSKNDLLSFVSVNKKARYVNGAGYFEKDGYRFIQTREIWNPKIKKLEINCKAGNEDIQLDYSRTPRLGGKGVVRRTAVFFNYAKKHVDSLSFYYSPDYTSYSNDLPRIVPNENYYKAPPSPIFAATLFKAMDVKIGECHNRPDSLNFLIKFVQSGVVFAEDIVIYGREDFCSFPENTLAIGKGDCEDKCELFAFLAHHYFEDIDIVFLFFPNHVQTALYDPQTAVGNMSCQEWQGKKYLITELQDERTVLGDEEFKRFHETPEEIVK